MPATLPSYPASTIAKLFNLTERRIQQLAKEGIIPKSERGKYSLVAVVQGYVKYLQDRAAGRSAGSYRDESDIKVERKRLITAQANKIESENHKLRGELVPFELVEDVLNEMAVLYGSGIDALPGRLANELAGINEPAEIKVRLFDECRQIRIATASLLRRFAETVERGETSRLNSRCAIESDAGSVGGQ
jgi:phage terminase Nu1 subunit (DNA packaging protein)